MNISLPGALKNWVEQQVSSKGFSTASEYVRDVLRKEQERQSREKIDAYLIAALKSGPSTPMTSGDWARIRAEGLKRARGKDKK